MPDIAKSKRAVANPVKLIPIIRPKASNATKNLRLANLLLASFCQPVFNCSTIC